MRVSSGVTLIFSIPPGQAAGRRTGIGAQTKSRRSCVNPWTGSGWCRLTPGSCSLLTSLRFSPPLSKARPCRNRLANDDILLEAHQVIRLSLYYCLCQDACGLLERSRRQEAISIERRPGDS